MPPAAGEIAADLDRPRRPDADDGPPRGDCTGHGAHLTAAGVDAGQDAAASMGTTRPMGSTPPAPLRAATHTTQPALHSYIGEDSTARRPHSTPHTAAPAMLHPAPPRWGQRTAARYT